MNDALTAHAPTHHPAPLECVHAFLADLLNTDPYLYALLEPASITTHNTNHELTELVITFPTRPCYAFHLHQVAGILPEYRDELQKHFGSRVWVTCKRDDE